ncbi:LPS assembly lipoprotein LptE [Pseudolabrys sp. FHR47]|uniref:LPS assembly lipoprotein LptE n=1 Tax=Pseudolabrys sp. FHR47 TaxID=2562284 RepID=UPI0010BE258A|nr:LPS assembly lipoprotein LptE [Pseudolabrys sp. FHR47]
MSSSSAPRLVRQLARAAFALALAGLTAGCFQPMYGSGANSPTAATPDVADRLSSVEVEQIVAAPATPIARLAVEVRNNLLFNLTGGGPTTASAYKLKIQLSSSTRQVIVDIDSARPEIQNYGLNATYTLIDSGTGKTLFTSYTFARVSYNTPGQQQRFAGDRGLRDAENRAAAVIAENIRNRLASYFVAGT